MGKDNRVVLNVKSIGENVSLVRMVAGGFLYPYDLMMGLDEGMGLRYGVMYP